MLEGWRKGERGRGREEGEGSKKRKKEKEGERRKEGRIRLGRWKDREGKERRGRWRGRRRKGKERRGRWRGRRRERGEGEKEEKEVGKNLIACRTNSEPAQVIPLAYACTVHLHPSGSHWNRHTGNFLLS